MRWLGLVVCFGLVLGCGRPPHAPPVRKAAVAPPASASAAPARGTELAPTPGCSHLVAQRLKGSAPSNWGSTQPSVWLTKSGSALQLWYPGGNRAPYRTAVLAEDGSLSAAADVTLFSGYLEAANPAVASQNGVTVVAATVYRTQQNADIMLALRTGARWQKSFAVLPDPALDSDPAVAFGAGGIGVAWRHGTYPSAPDLSFAVVSPAGRVLSGGVVEQGAEAEGLALVGVKDGWLLLYTPSSALSRSRRALIALRLDAQGHVVSRHVVLRGDALWPIAAWNGREVGVAFRSDLMGHSTVTFVRLAPDGTRLFDPVVADQHPDPIAGFRPMSLIPVKGGWWLADVAGFMESVHVARPMEGRVVELDAGGHPVASVVVSDRGTGSTLVRIVAHGDGVRGVLVEDRGHQQLRAFDVGCGKAPSPEKPDACAARSEGFPAGRYAPFRGLLEATAEAGGDLVLGYRPLKTNPYRPTAGNVLVSRMSPDGQLVWTADLGAGYHPGVAFDGKRVAALFKTGGGRPESLAILDAKSGAVKNKRQLAKDAGSGCIAPTPSGWLVVHGAPYSGGHKPQALLLARDGTLRARHDLDERLNACALLPAPGGFLLAYTHPGQVSETNFLFVRKLDANGRATGAGRRIPGVHFAREPGLFRRGKLPLLLFKGPLGRSLSAVVLDDQGGAKSKVITVAETYGLLGAALWGNEFVWSTDKQLGRRGCLDQLLAP